MAQIATVPYRNIQHKSDDLGMRCDDHEMPHPIDADRADSYFTGVARLAMDDIQQDGTIAVFIFGKQIGFILAPIDNELPAYWISSTTDELAVSSEGTQGLLRKRPKFVIVNGSGFSLRVGEIMQFWPVREAMQPWRSAQFLAAVTES